MKVAWVRFLLKLDTSSMNVEFYSLSNSFYFIILCYIGRKYIYLFCGGLQFQDLSAQKVRPLGDDWFFKI